MGSSENREAPGLSRGSVTDDQIEGAVVAYTQGATLSRIAGRLGVSIPTVRYWLDKRGIARRPPGRPFTPEEIAGIRDRYRRGESTEALAAAYHCRETRVADVLRAHGELRSRSEAGRVGSTKRSEL